jgi:hypothetical protein
VRYAAKGANLDDIRRKAKKAAEAVGVTLVRDPVGLVVREVEEDEPKLTLQPYPATDAMRSLGPPPVPEPAVTPPTTVDWWKATRSSDGTTLRAPLVPALTQAQAHELNLRLTPSPVSPIRSSLSVTTAELVVTRFEDHQWDDLREQVDTRLAKIAAKP